ncbi:MAG: histidine kinase [Tannerellaceae bacterium]|nr:histidine kinase [Tannerellaceae bacterium]
MCRFLQKTDQLIPDWLIAPRYRVARHLFLQVVVLCITLNIFWDTPDHFIFTSARLFGWMIYFGVINFLIYFNRYYLAPRYLLTRRTTGYVIAVSILITAAILVIGVSQGVISGNEESPHPGNTGNILLGTLSSILSIGFVVAGVSASIVFINWLIFNQRIDELESATLQSELKVLKNQINPHFLFNMLNNANYLIMDNRQEAAEVLLKLEDLLRYQLNDTNRDKVWLSEDIRFLNDYLNLEKFRRDDFDYMITKEGPINGVEVPPFLFIPFVENAVKHSQDGDIASFVHLSFRVQDQTVTFLCENTIPPTPDKQDDKPGGVSGSGISNAG